MNTKKNIVSTKLKLITTKVVSFCLLAAFIVPANTPFTTNVAHAGAGFALETTQQQNFNRLTNILQQNTAINRQTDDIMVRTQDRQQQVRVDDPAQWLANQQMVSDSANNILEFIGSGFGGNPAFVQNLPLLQQTLADQLGMGFISRLGETLDTPFTGDLQRALLGIHQRNMRGEEVGYNAQSVIGDLDGFLGGDFAAGGGWAGILAMSQNPQNTPLGAFFTARERMDQSIQQGLANEETILNWDQGMRSMQECTEVDGRQQCFRTTPGSAIGAQMNKALGVGLDSAIGANAFGMEFDADLEQGFVRLAEQALTGSAGILGLDMLAGFNLESLLAAMGIDPNNIFADFIDLLFGDDENFTDDQGRVEASVIAEVRESVGDVLAVQEAIVSEVVDLAATLAELPADEANAIVTEIFGDDLSILDDIQQGLIELEALDNRLSNISSEANSSSLTESDILREVIRDLSVLQRQLPGQIELDRLRQSIADNT